MSHPGAADVILDNVKSHYQHQLKYYETPEQTGQNKTGGVRGQERTETPIPADITHVIIFHTQSFTQYPQHGFIYCIL